VKASSAGSIEGNGSIRGLFGDSKGSSAPWARNLPAVLTLAICALALTAAPALANGPTPTATPTVTIDTPTASYTTIQASGTINPNGGPGPIAKYFYVREVGTENIRSIFLGQMIGGEAKGHSPIPISTTPKGDFTGLKPGTEYEVFIDAYTEFFQTEDTLFGGVSNYPPQPFPIVTTLPVAPPSVDIDNASQVGISSAKATGEVHRPANTDHAFDSKCAFEYITDDAYAANDPGERFSGATTVACTDPLIEEGDDPKVGANLTGLHANTTYHLRIKGTNPGGSESKEAASTFTTKSATAPAVALNPASEVKYTIAHISGTIDPEGGNINPLDGPSPIAWQLETNLEGAGWEFRQGGVISNLEAESDSPIEVPANVSGLQSGAEYQYRLVAFYAGETVTSSEGSFETKAPITAPAVEANDASLVAGTTAHFSGHVTPGETDPGFDSSCKFEYVTDAEFQPHNEQQRLFIAATGGTYTLTFTPPAGAADTTAPIPFDASAATVQAALQALPAIGAGAAAVAGGPGDEQSTRPYTITFAGALADTDVEELGADGSLLASGEAPSATVSTIKEGSDGFGAAKTIDCPPNPVKGTGAVEVIADPSGLEPHTTYHLRLWAQNQGGTATDDAPDTFLTEPTAPIVSATAAHEVTTATATLNAQINPRGASTTYHFEYLTLEEFEAAGEDFAGATATPESASIGSDNESHPALAAIEGLAPDTAYRFRVVASNEKSPSGGTASPVGSFRTVASAADSCPNAAVRAQQGSGYLADCRAYEQVSPVNKHGYLAGVNSGGEPYFSTATADGNAVIYGGNGPIGEATRGLQEASISRRLPDGSWSTKSAIPAVPEFQTNVLTHAVRAMTPSADFRSLAFLGAGPYVTGGISGLYRSNADGSVDWLSRPQPPISPSGFGFGEMGLAGVSPDLSTVYFWSNPHLLPEDDDHTDGGRGLYEYTDGELKPAGTLPDGSESPGGAVPANTSANVTDPENVAGQVSADGSTLFFISPAVGGPIQLYVRRGGHSTLVSHLPGGAAAPSGVASVPGMGSNLFSKGNHEYVYGSPDGKTAIFQSVDALTPDAPNNSSQKAYRYDVETDTVSYLPGVGSTIVAATNDLQHFLFGGAPFGPSKIAIWDEGTIKTIYSGQANVLAPARTNPSGSVFFFSTKAAIPGFNNSNPSLGERPLEIYRYEVAGEKLSCISCPPDDVAPSSDAVLSNNDHGFPDGGVLSQTRGISTDANRVFFDTSESLVPRDSGGRDVYEWTPGRISLISGGHGFDSLFLDNSADGNDVFFATTEGLDPADTDGSYDVFDAHVDGGFLKREVTPCAGEECLEGASTPAGAVTAASKSFAGAGNQVQPKKGHKKKKHHKKKSHHKRAAHNRGGSK
jgi:hypothetical protein